VVTLRSFPYPPIHSLYQLISSTAPLYDQPPRPRTANFLYVMGFWYTWSHEICMLLVGLPMLAFAVAVAAQVGHTERGLGLSERLHRSMQALVAFVWFSPALVKAAPACHCLRMQVLCRNLLCAWSLLGVVVLFPGYVSAAGLYQCGAVWLRGTLAYTAGNSAAEWCISVAACFFAGLSTAAISMLQSQECLDEAKPPGAAGLTQRTWQKEGILLLVWAPIVCTLSSPMVLYVLSLSLPPDENVLGLSAHFLSFVKGGIGVLLYVIKSLVLPNLANKVAEFVYGRQEHPPPNTSGRLVMGAMAVISALVPAVTLLVVNQDCGGGWLQLWRPCSLGSQFDTSLNQVVRSFKYVTPCTGYTQRGYIASADTHCFGNSSSLSLRHMYVPANIHIQTIISSHEQICRPGYVADGRCPRALVGSLGNLYAKELIASASISPIITLLQATPQIQALKAWLARNVLRQSGYGPNTSINRMVFGAVLCLELPLLVGFCYPALPVLAWLVVTLNAGVLYTATTYLDLKIALDSPARISVKYLWGSFALGCALIMWLCVECNWHSKWLTVLGMPMCAMAGYACWYLRDRRGGIPAFHASLSEPLFTDESGLGVSGITLEPVYG